jgi:hypothetical protein
MKLDELATYMYIYIYICISMHVVLSSLRLAIVLRAILMPHCF